MRKWKSPVGPYHEARVQNSKNEAEVAKLMVGMCKLDPGLKATGFKL